MVAAWRRVVGNVLIVVFLSLLAFGGIRGVLLGDLRFSWGMFAYEIESEVTYAWVVVDDVGGAAGGAGAQRVVPYKPPASELKFRMRRIAPGKRIHGYGIGAYRNWVHNYLAWLWEHGQRPPGAVRVQATVTWSREHEPAVTEVLAVPAVPEAAAAP